VKSREEGTNSASDIRNNEPAGCGAFRLGGYYSPPGNDSVCFLARVARGIREASGSQES